MGENLKVSENRVRSKIFAAKRDEVTEEWSRLHNEELNDLYCSPDIVWVIKMRTVRLAEHVVCMGDRRGAYRVLVRRPEGKRSLGKTQT